MKKTAQPTSYVVIRGKFLPDQIEVTYSPNSSRILDPHIEASIEVAWAKQLKRAEQKGMQLYDSEAYRLNAFQNVSNHLELELAPVSYKVHAAMKDLHNDPRVTEQHYDKTLIADSLVKTLDGKYILGKVNKVVENSVYLIGGTCAKSRIEIVHASDLFSYASQRTAEILGIAEDDIVVEKLLGLIQNEVGCVNAIFDVHLTLSSNDVVHAFRPNNGVSELIILNESDLITYLSRSRGYVVAVRELL